LNTSITVSSTKLLSVIDNTIVSHYGNAFHYNVVQGTSMILSSNKIYGQNGLLFVNIACSNAWTIQDNEITTTNIALQLNSMSVYCFADGSIINNVFNGSVYYTTTGCDTGAFQGNTIQYVVDRLALQIVSNSDMEISSNTIRQCEVTDQQMVILKSQGAVLHAYNNTFNNNRVTHGSMIELIGGDSPSVISNFSSNIVTLSYLSNDSSNFKFTGYTWLFERNIIRNELLANSFLASSSNQITTIVLANNYWGINDGSQLRSLMRDALTDPELSPIIFTPFFYDEALSTSIYTDDTTKVINEMQLITDTNRLLTSTYVAPTGTIIVTSSLILNTDVNLIVSGTLILNGTSESKASLIANGNNRIILRGDARMTVIEDGLYISGSAFFNAQIDFKGLSNYPIQFSIGTLLVKNCSIYAPDSVIEIGNLDDEILSGMLLNIVY
jgi:hypothetical protein